MTRYQTAEQTAAPHQYPAGIPATPHLAYLLLLACLLLAPIAGDVAAQLVYKAPFAVALLAGTALLAAACDHLTPGAGRYPWLAVAGIYAVPVAWNLVVIAGHTGFHVDPAELTSDFIPGRR